MGGHCRVEGWCLLLEKARCTPCSSPFDTGQSDSEETHLPAPAHLANFSKVSSFKDHKLCPTMKTFVCVVLAMAISTGKLTHSFSIFTCFQCSEAPTFKCEPLTVKVGLMLTSRTSSTN